MNAPPQVIFTRHAETVIAERQIDRRWIKQALRQPDFAKADPKDETVTLAFRRIAEREDRVLRVAYRREGERMLVITAFFDRAQRAKPASA